MSSDVTGSQTRFLDACNSYQARCDGTIECLLYRISDLAKLDLKSASS
jgi:hypothetical protein